MAGSKKPSSKSNTVKKRENDNHIRETIILLIVFAIAILLFISNFGVGGFIGNGVSDFLFGLFGLFSFAFPIALLYICLSILNVSRLDKTGFAVVKLIASILFILFLCMFMDLVTYGGEVVKPSESFKYGFENHNGGGFFGGLLAFFLVKAFGVIGSYVISIIVLLISLVLILERTPILFVRRKKEELHESAEAHREVRRQERNQRRMDKKAYGVTEDITISKAKKRKQKRTDAMKELMAEDDLDLPEILSERKTALESNGNSSVVSERSFIDAPVIEPVKVDINNIENQMQNFLDSDIEINGDYQADQHNNVSDTTTVKKRRTEYMGQTEKAQAIEEVKEVVSSGSQNDETKYKNYKFPPIDLLKAGSNRRGGNTESELKSTAAKLEQTLATFGVEAKVTNISCGPAVTRYELEPKMGVKVSKIVGLADDIKLNLAAADIRIEAPIPGKAAVGIEVPNKENVAVSFRELIESNDFQNSKANLSFAVGKDIAGKIKVTDIAKMPHLLIAGATGSGKSVCINTIIMSILYKANPEDVKLLMIDPKVVELSVYNGIPHLMIPVVTDPKKAAGALQWAVAEMTERYQKFADKGVRDMAGYNEAIAKNPVEGEKKLPQIVVIVDELADLMMVASGDVEEAICRLAQLARAAGIHLIIATQRPSVNVITGLIKANMPSRIAFAVTSSVDSRTILDMGGAEKLLGKGDMLFYPQGLPKPLRVQGAWVRDEEVADVVEFLKQNHEAVYDDVIRQKVETMEANSNKTVSIDGGESLDGGDPLFIDAAKIIVDKEKASIGMLQRYLKIGFNRAARIMDELEEAGVVGPEMGTKPRTVLMSQEQLDNYLEEN